MVTKEQISRINELAHKQKSIGLTAEEREEQKMLRRAYIDAFKENLRAQLDRIEIVDAPEEERVVEEKVEVETLQ
ncbi:MAG: DUF896 domain-containing protein [Eubacterium sp.]|nr:DUF896 domain-containing protein [Eubacterium sp.]MCI2197191.1 DUF896 domain-containing protein [Eubacterium sp.]